MSKLKTLTIPDHHGRIHSMNREDIIRMAREAGGHVSSFHGRWVMYASDLERFAALVAAAEREECAKVCDEVGGRDTDSHAWDAATAIRGRNA